MLIGGWEYLVHAPIDIQRLHYDLQNTHFESYNNDNNI